MINWILLDKAEQIDAVRECSTQVPCLIFKHSTRCSLSSIAKMRLEKNWDFQPNEMKAYYLDLIAHRPISNMIAEAFGVHHESPQVLLINKGVCVYDASHLDINVAELHITN